MSKPTVEEMARELGAAKICPNEEKYYFCGSEMATRCWLLLKDEEAIRAKYAEMKIDSLY